MPQHLTEEELDKIAEWKSLTTSEILQRLGRRREQQGLDSPCLRAVQRAVVGQTYRRGRSETRGRKRTLSAKNVRKLNVTRKALIKDAAGESEIHWSDVIKKARVPKVHRSTAYRSLQNAGINVRARTPRQKPMRTKDHLHNRLRICRKWASLPATYFTNKIDLIMDNKKWDIPTSVVGKRFAKMKKVRFHLRTPNEGVKPGFTKPDKRKQRVNPGGKVDVCAGIIKGKIRLWHYLPKTNWCGKVAADTYKGPIAKALAQHAGRKRKYLVMEDNDPTGYKSNAAKKAKEEAGIHALEYPQHSPDLNPMDFYVWAEIERRMSKHRAPRNETQAQYKARLRRTAMNLPEAVVRKAVLSIKARAKAIVEAKGGDIPRD